MRIVIILVSIVVIVLVSTVLIDSLTITFISIHVIVALVTHNLKGKVVMMP